MQNILRSIKFLGIFISKILSSFFVKNNESKVFMKRFRRDKVSEKSEAKRKETHKTEGKQSEEFFAMCLTLNTLLRNKWNSYRYANFLAKVVIRECKQSWIENRKSMKQHNKEFSDCVYLSKFIKVKESRGLVRMNTFIQFQKQESSLSRDSRRHIS